MHLDRVFTTCPHLTGSPEGAVCQAVLALIRNIEDIDPDICISRHFEVCRIYISKLQEIDVIPASAGDVTIEQI